MRQEMVVIGNEWNFRCCAERREFSIVRIFDEGKVVGIDTAGKLSLWAKEISELIPTERWNSAQNKLGLAPGRFVPNQLKTSFPDSREDTRRCAFRVEFRGYEDIRVDDNPFHSDFIHHKLAKISPKILALAPSSRASTGRLGSGSKVMIGSQPAIRAATIPARPTRRPHKPRSTVPRRTVPHSAPHWRGAARTVTKARYPKTSGLSSKPVPFGCCQACLSGASVKDSHSSSFLLDTCGIGGAVGSTKPAAAMRARTGQGRDRLPSCPHPVWSSIQFATGCRSDRGSRRSCHTPVR